MSMRTCTKCFCVYNSSYSIGKCPRCSTQCAKPTIAQMANIPMPKQKHRPGRCDLCGTDSYDLETHRGSPICQAAVSNKEYETRGLRATMGDRQPLLEEFGIGFEVGNLLRRGRIMEVLWVRPAVELITQSTDEDFIRWGLSKITKDPEFPDYVEVLFLGSGAEEAAKILQNLYMEEIKRAYADGDPIPVSAEKVIKARQVLDAALRAYVDVTLRVDVVTKNDVFDKGKLHLAEIELALTRVGELAMSWRLAEMGLQNRRGQR